MSSTASRRDRKRKPKARLSFGSSNGSSGNLPSNMRANLPELLQLLKSQNEELEVTSKLMLNGNMLHSCNGIQQSTTDSVHASPKRESFMEREVVGSKPAEVSLLREDYPRKGLSIEELVEKTRSLLKTEGPLEERDILKGIGLSQGQVGAVVPTTLGAHLVEKHKGFQSAKEGNLEYFYYCSEDEDDDNTRGNTNKGTDVITSDIAATTTTTTTTTTTSTYSLASATPTVGTTTVEHHNLPTGCKSWCTALENSSCSNSAYESAEDEDTTWAMPRSATPLSMGSGMSPPPVVRAPVVSHNQETQTELPAFFWRTVGVMTATTSSASVHTQTDQPDEAAILKVTLQKRDIEISELQEALRRQSCEHREEIQQLHSRLSKLQMQLQKVAEDKQASPPLPSVKQQAPTKEPEIHSLLIEPKRETVSPRTNGDRKALDKTEFRDFYELQMKMEQQSGGGGSCSDLESMWSSRGGSPKRSKKVAQEEGIIRRLKREKPNFTEAHIREYLNKFREKQCSLTGMTVKAIVAGILALMKSDALSTQHF